MENRDVIIHNQLKVISELINRNLKELSESLMGSEKIRENPVEGHDNVVKFPINRRPRSEP